MTKSLLFTLNFLILFNVCQAQDKKEKNLKIWFNHPALDWNEALPVGNGRLGAMVFGGISQERIQLNEESVWVGKPVDFVNPESKGSLPKVRQLLFDGRYAEAQKLAQEKIMGDKKVWSSYQTLGNIHINFGELSKISDYKRELDLETAVSKVRFRSNNTLFTREVFSSFPDQSLVIRLLSDKKGAISFEIDLSREGNKAMITAEGSEILLSEHVGDGNGVKIIARLKVLNEGGEITIKENTIIVKKADAATILLTAGTNYWGKDPIVTSREQLQSVQLKSYDHLKKEHMEDYQRYFNRVELNLGSSDAIYFPTDTRITAVQKGNKDPQLIELFYQYGRYLLISSSREGGLPANLQGIWADGLTPPWSADYHININIQMNYWMSETTNLSELHLPFLHYLNALQTDGKKTAKDMYGLPGSVAHFSSDAWHYTEPHGQTQWAMWPMGLAWSVQHIWEHYLFTGDKQQLKEFYPSMKNAAEFCAEWLIKDPSTKKLVSGPSISPENTFKTKEGAVATMVMGPTMDHMIIRDLFKNTIDASIVLNTDKTLRDKLKTMLTQLAPTRVGKDGRIMEWTEEFEEPEPGHRHISHLFALHPGREITRQNSELFAAARKTIDYRLSHGGGHTGWSRAWIINFFARLQDGEKAHENLVALLQKSTLPNLFDSHPPFQIDGNFGATAGITEMLLQSHAGEIQLLPALPSEWKKGNINGICARGGFELDLDWEDGELKKIKIHSKLGNQVNIRYGEKVYNLKSEKGKYYQFNGALQLM